MKMILLGLKTNIIDKEMNSFLNFITRILPIKTFGADKGFKWLSVGERKDQAILLGLGKHLGGWCVSTFESDDGLNFSPASKRIKLNVRNGFIENITQSTGFRLSKLNDNFYLTSITKKGDKASLVFAESNNGEDFSVFSETDTITETGQLVPNYRFRDSYVLYFGEEHLKIAFSKDLKNWQVIEKPVLSPRENTFDHKKLEVMGVTVTDKGLLVIYDCSYKDDQKNHIQCGGVLFSLSDPDNVIWRSEIPLFEEITDLGLGEPLGVIFNEENLFLYWATNEDLLISSIPMPFSSKVKNGINLLKRHPANPIISPDGKHDWESEGTFNSAAVYLDGKVHIIYRAVGKDGISSFGYAVSKNGFDIDERLDYPIFSSEGINKKPKNYKDLCATGLYSSGGSWGGCEDPKLTKIDGRIYMTYVAFNGWAPQRVAVTSISEEDFKNKNWDWEDPIMMSAPDVINKSACILPEKINNKYVVFHRIFPDILIDYVDDLKFGENNWLQGQYKIPARPSFWDSRKLSIGATPIKTDLGWLVIYHAIDDRDPSRYKIGAMILDHHDLSKVLFRTNKPILVPEKGYENDGKPGVVYPSGAVVLGDDLFVYYGGGDKFVCVATTPMNYLLDHLQLPENKQIYWRKSINRYHD